MDAKIFLLFILLGFSQLLLSLNIKEDSLRNVIQTAAQDTNKINALNALAKIQGSKNTNDEAMKLAGQFGGPKGKKFMYRQLKNLLIENFSVTNGRAKTKTARSPQLLERQSGTGR